MKDIVLNAKDYGDFNTVYSEKNNIDNIVGEEYLVTTSDSTSFEIVDGGQFVKDDGTITIEYYDKYETLPTIRPEDVGRIISYKNTYSYYIGAVNPSEPSGYSWQPIELKYPFKKIGNTTITNETRNIANRYTFTFADRVNDDPVCLREEQFIIKGSFKARTQSIISNTKDISAKTTTEYNIYKSDENRIDINNYAKAIPVYENIRYAEQVETSTTEDKLPSERCVYTKEVAWIPSAKIVNGDGIATYSLSTPKIISVDEDGTTVMVDYEICLWFGFNKFDANFIIIPITSGSSTLYNANKITFNIQANSIQASSNNFSLGEGKLKQYQMESNELMQYTDEQSYNERQSYKTCQKILERYAIHRQIATFKLYRCDNEDFSNSVEDRVIRRFTAGDMVKLRNPNGEYIGGYYDSISNYIIPYFEIVTYKPHWDGSYYVEVGVKQSIPDFNVSYETSGHETVAIRRTSSEENDDYILTNSCPLFNNQQILITVSADDGYKLTSFTINGVEQAEKSVEILVNKNSVDENGNITIKTISVKE